MEHKLNKLLIFSLCIWIFFTLFLHSQDNSKSILPLNIINENFNLLRNDVVSDSLDIPPSYIGELFLQSVLPGERGFGNMLMFDCNHNNKKEFIYARTGVLYFIEVSGKEYKIVHQLNGFYNPIAVGDIDNDELTDLVVQEGNFVKVFENKNYFSFPDSAVWKHTLGGVYGTGNVQQNGKITDLDKDGNKEILITSNQFTLLDYGAISVFEVISDNNYQRNIYFTFHHEGSGLGSLAVGDFNENGTYEIACAAGIGDTLYVFEVVSDDSMQLQFKTFTGLKNQYSVIGGNDLDKDGKKEILISGDAFNPAGVRSIIGFEALAPNKYEQSFEIRKYTGLTGIQPITSGDIISSSGDELVLQAHSTFIYNSAYNNFFSLIDTIAGNLSPFAYCYDVEPGKYSELQIVGGTNVLVYANKNLRHDAFNKNEKNLKQLLISNYPNPFNPSTTIVFGVPVKSQVSLKIFNSVGEQIARLVNEVKPSGNYTVEFNAANLSSGVYFYTLDAVSISGNKQTKVSKKMILIK